MEAIRFYMPAPVSRQPLLPAASSGGVFNLGQTNTVNAQTRLQGTATQPLYVVNQSTLAGSTASLGDRGKGTGVCGADDQPDRRRAEASRNVGVNYGLDATAASDKGLAG